MTLTKPLKIAFIGCVEFSYTMLEHLINFDNKAFEISAVVSKSCSSFNSDHVSLISMAQSLMVPYLDTTENADSLVSFLTQVQPDVIYCFGWSELLPAQALDLAPLGVIGYHPTKLPKNRGRHPIIWPLVLGMSETASTFFKMDESADSGPIVSQENVVISNEDDASNLYEKLAKVAKKQLLALTQALINNQLKPIEQDHTMASYWRKRTPKDGVIDWRMQAQDIYNLIRGLTRPYIGAEFHYSERIFKVWRSRVTSNVYDRAIIPGTVLEIPDETHNWFTVKCGGESALSFPLESSNDQITQGSML